jgi:hypothetical protein
MSKLLLQAKDRRSEDNSPRMMISAKKIPDDSRRPLNWAISGKNISVQTPNTVRKMHKRCICDLDSFESTPIVTKRCREINSSRV